MRKLMLPLSSLLSGVGLLVLGVGLLFSVLGLRAGLADFSTVTTGLVMSAYFVAAVLVAGADAGASGRLPLRATCERRLLKSYGEALGCTISTPPAAAASPCGHSGRYCTAAQGCRKSR